MILVALGHDVVGGSVPVATDVIDYGVDPVRPLFKLVGGVLLSEDSLSEGSSECHLGCSR